MSAPLSAILNPPSTILSPPSTPKKALTQLTQDQQIWIQVLQNLGWMYKNITQKYDITFWVIQWACTHPQTPKKQSDRPSQLSEEQIESLVEFVMTSKENHWLPYYWIPEILRFNCSINSIQYALKKQGFKRCLVHNKPPISEKNQQLWLVWALEHINWIQKQWYNILWSDETWVTGETHWKVYVTQQMNEELNSSCIVKKISQRTEWMFWGCFADITKGLCLFWEKKWDTINKKIYQDHVMPLIHDWIRYVLPPTLQLLIHCF